MFWDRWLWDLTLSVTWRDDSFLSSGNLSLCESHVEKLGSALKLSRWVYDLFWVSLPQISRQGDGCNTHLPCPSVKTIKTCEVSSYSSAWPFSFHLSLRYVPVTISAPNFRHVISVWIPSCTLENPRRKECLTARATDQLLTTVAMSVVSSRWPALRKILLLNKVTGVFLDRDLG
jgi:hypothetical protein